MRKIAAALLGCLLLAGCGSSSWQDEVRYKVVSVENVSGEMYKLELVGAAPKGVLWPEVLSPKFEKPDAISGDVSVGDEVVCTAKQEKGSAVASYEKETKLSGCKKA